MVCAARRPVGFLGRPDAGSVRPFVNVVQRPAIVRPVSCFVKRQTTTYCAFSFRARAICWPRKYFETTMLVACCDHDLRNLDVALLEDDLALLVADHRGADLPLHLVERVDARQREIARKLRARARAPWCLAPSPSRRASLRASRIRPLRRGFRPAGRQRRLRELGLFPSFPPNSRRSYPWTAVLHA